MKAWGQSGLTFSNVTHFQLFSDPSIFQEKKKKEGKKNPTSQMLIKSYIHLTNGFEGFGTSAELCLLVKIHLKMDKY